MFVVADRGETRNTPESTLDASGKAIDKGVEGIEFDVRYTKDGVAVALHDDSVNRTTDCQGLISELTYTFLKTCSAKDSLGLLFKDDHVPTVEESLAYIHRRSAAVKVFMHFKTSITDAQAAAVRNTASTAGVGAQAIYVSEYTAQRTALAHAGVPYDELGLMVHKNTDYSRSYRWLVPYMPDVTAKLVGPAIQNGHTVLPVETVPASLETIVAAGCNGVYLNDLDDALAYLKARGLH